MATTLTEDLFPDARNPEGTIGINEKCVMRTQSGHRVVVVCGVVLANYALDDRMSEAYAMVSLVEQGWADQNDVARAFGCSPRTVRRHQRRFEHGGMAALGQSRGFPPGRGRQQPSRTQWIHRLKSQGHSNREIARHLGVSEVAIRKSLRRMGWKQSSLQPDLLPLEEPSSSVPTAWPSLDFRRCHVGDECEPKTVRFFDPGTRGDQRRHRSRTANWARRSDASSSS